MIIIIIGPTLILVPVCIHQVLSHVYQVVSLGCSIRMIIKLMLLLRQTIVVVKRDHLILVQLSPNFKVIRNRFSDAKTRCSTACLAQFGPSWWVKPIILVIFKGLYGLQLV